MSIDLNQTSDVLLREWQIIGRKEVTAEEAARNRQEGRTPKRPRPGHQALIPISHTSWWQGIRKGKFPRPVSGFGVAVWRKSELASLIQHAQPNEIQKNPRGRPRKALPKKGGAANE